MQCARALIDDHGLDSKDILILEAQDYIGGRIKQNTDFVKNVKIDLGAEIIHGNNTVLTKLAEKANETITANYCWAHGDGGPFEEDVNGLYGLYYIGNTLYILYCTCCNTYTYASFTFIIVYYLSYTNHILHTIFYILNIPRMAILHIQTTSILY